jgi:exodeoxyribonuclease-3
LLETELAKEVLEPIDIIAWNVNGLRHIWQKGYLPGLLSLHNPEILCLSELKCTPARLKGYLNYMKNRIARFGYTDAFWNPCGEKHGYSGVAVITKHRPDRVVKGFLHKPLGQHTQEGRIITLFFRDFALVHTYTPCSGKDLKFEKKRADWDSDFSEHLRLIKKATTLPVIWSGDQNVALRDCDVWDGKHNPKRKFCPSFTDGERERTRDMLEAHSLEDAYVRFHGEERQNHFTYFRHNRDRKRNRGWRVDHYFVDRSLFEHTSKLRVLDVRPIHSQIGSDHLPCKLEAVRVEKKTGKWPESEPKVPDITREGENVSIFRKLTKLLSEVIYKRDAKPEQSVPAAGHQGEESVRNREREAAAMGEEAIQKDVPPIFRIPKLRKGSRVRNSDQKASDKDLKDPQERKVVVIRKNFSKKKSFS